MESNGSLIHGRIFGANLRGAGQRTRLIVLRHGEVNVERAPGLYGQFDAPLSERGVEQSHAAAEKLRGMELAAVASSDLQRARYLADLIAQERGLTVHERACFRERNFGEWQGLTWEQIEERWPHELTEYQKNPLAPIIPGGETYDQVSSRTLRGLDEFLIAHRGQTVVLAAHMGTIRVIAANALGLDLRNTFSIFNDNCTMTVIDYYDNGRAALRTLGG
ncbi:histidine phosphatase family protein [Candidatus Sumerlaeota bacterium]|nr:histidine phosphatase family protein [Candidatus Sumerlaeota bacterium]